MRKFCNNIIFIIAAKGYRNCTMHFWGCTFLFFSFGDDAFTVRPESSKSFFLKFSLMYFFWMLCFASNLNYPINPKYFQWKEKMFFFYNIHFLYEYINTPWLYISLSLDSPTSFCRALSSYKYIRAGLTDPSSSLPASSSQSFLCCLRFRSFCSCCPWFDFFFLFFSSFFLFCSVAPLFGGHIHSLWSAWLLSLFWPLRHRQRNRLKHFVLSFRLPVVVCACPGQRVGESVIWFSLCLVVNSYYLSWRCNLWPLTRVCQSTFPLLRVL